MSQEANATYDAHIQIIRHLPIASGIQRDLTNSFRVDVLSKIDVRYYNLELLYCAYYFLDKDDIHNVVRENRDNREVVIRYCKSWINEYLNSEMCTQEERRLVPYFEGKYSKKSTYNQKFFVLDLLRYIDIILFTQSSTHMIPDTEVKTDDTDFDKLRVYTSNEHMLVGSVKLEYDDIVDYDDEDD